MKEVLETLEAHGATEATPQSKLDELGLDSLEFLSVCVDLDIEAEQAAGCKTVADLARLVPV